MKNTIQGEPEHVESGANGHQTSVIDENGIEPRKKGSFT
jgi:hypothetical protein